MTLVNLNLLKTLQPKKNNTNNLKKQYNQLKKTIQTIK